MENGNRAVNSNPITGSADSGETDTGSMNAKGSWTSPSIIRLSGKETDGKTTNYFAEIDPWAGPS